MKKFKGFTLLELIIVMAILAILMTAILQMFKPIRETYVDATMIESQRTTQTGMTRYITESIRFSTDLGMYTGDAGGVATATEAVEAFAAVYLPANGVQPSDSNYDDNVDELKKYAEIIVIDNNAAYTYNGKTDWRGRILRRKITGSELVNVEPTAANIATSAVNSDWRLALGSAYYGESDYTVSFTITQDPSTLEGSASDGIMVSVTSQVENNMRGTYTDDDGVKRSSTPLTTTNSMVICKNQTEAGGIFDTTKFNSGNATAPGTKVYIVFLNEKINIVP